MRQAAAGLRGAEAQEGSQDQSQGPQAPFHCLNSSPEKGLLVSCGREAGGIKEKQLHCLQRKKASGRPREKQNQEISVYC